MQLIPDWAPNIHPLIIHFPIALLFLAVLADVLGLVFKKYRWFNKAAIGLFFTGWLGAVAAYLSGREAAEIVKIPSVAFPVISRHADLALIVVWFFGIYALLRIVLSWKGWDRKIAVSVILFLIGAGGLILVQQTAERGGELVYRYGLGVAAVEAQENQATEISEEEEIPELMISEDGSWILNGGDEVDKIFAKSFSLLSGNIENLQIGIEHDALTLTTKQKSSFIFTVGAPAGDVVFTAEVNLRDFDGRFLLVHHVQDSSTYDFFAVDKGQARLGRKQNGIVKIWDTGAIQAPGWLTLKAVGTKKHFRGYINEKLIAHGHGMDLPPGKTGFAFTGSGKVIVKRMEVQSLDSE
ncbi:MAG: hypothetical protein GXO77_04805 [Calditrichaeota bacterium]|nr:hypothetical protein [Calditrichota bacterium]